MIDLKQRLRNDPVAFCNHFFSDGCSKVILQPYQKRLMQYLCRQEKRNTCTIVSIEESLAGTYSNELAIIIDDMSLDK